ncbi:hypothetical protein QYF36_001766 [Acer negundo]|nr:hypothetical protein QYF36_001766 [Acer negundo]
MKSLDKNILFFLELTQPMKKSLPCKKKSLNGHNLTAIALSKDCRYTELLDAFRKLRGEETYHGTMLTPF